VIDEGRVTCRHGLVSCQCRSDNTDTRIVLTAKKVHPKLGAMVMGKSAIYVSVIISACRVKVYECEEMGR